MQPSNAPSAAVAGPASASQESSGATLPLSPLLPKSFTMEREGPLAGTPAAAPVTASSVARTVTWNAPTCMSDAHDSVSAAQHRVFVSLPSAVTSHAASTSPTLPPRRPRKLALASAHMLVAPQGSHGNGGGSSEDLLSEHTATPPAPSHSLDADTSRLRDMHNVPDGERQPSNGPAHGGLGPHHRRMHTLPWLSEGALSAPAESRTANLLPPAPRQVDAAAISDAEDAVVRARALSVPATAGALASTRSSARRASVPSPPPSPEFETPAVPSSHPLTKENQDNLSPSYGCSMSIPSSSLAVSPFTHQSSSPSPTIVACCPARGGTGQKAVQRHQSQSAPPSTVACRLLSTGCTAGSDMPVVLRAGRRHSSYVSRRTMLSSFCLTEDGGESSEGSATATADTPLMRSNTNRAAAFSSAAAAAAAAMTMASATPYASPSLNATQRCRSASALMRCASSFSNRDDSSVNASAAEAALLSTPSKPPPCPSCALFSAVVSEMQNDRGKGNGEVAATAPAVVVASGMPLSHRLLTAPATGARGEDLSWFLPSFSDGNAQGSLAAAPQHLRACLAAECDSAMRAMQRQEVWAEQTAAGREELRRQVEGHIVAKHHSQAEGLCEDASAWRLPQEAPWPEQQLLSGEAVLLDDAKSSACSAAATTIAVAGEAPPSPALFRRLISTPLPCMGFRRGTATQPEVHALMSTRSEPAEDDQDAVAVVSPVERKDVEDSAIFEKSGLAESQRRPSRGEAAASVPLPPGAPRSRASVSFLGSSLSYEAALLAAAQEMSG
ncbi:hypothetical protein, unknown function [Leishmania mexicana MHOM/GT/2001/U1103]|uniref:Uncharacterized protein n=1 Tax=Leishmania mexicana (strain MHOM/GT/2001/U1103) TaxID=929439 RepID=E9ANX4_LEIMU|nr:hypothetical protein, unknown function [Leishmania mexicana MHOM/GT/2001/U1103]CBZ24638.1 hypothetical protein, unknown function [Leishmania mexicana MHOM/GT/2001/U1103]